MPDFKTISDFRRDSGPAIRAAYAQFIVLCRQLNLFTRTIVAIDGSKFKAVNNRDKNFTVAKVGKRIEQVGGTPLPDQDPRKGQNRDEPAGAGLRRFEWANVRFLRVLCRILLGREATAIRRGSELLLTRVARRVEKAGGGGLPISAL
jgi:hypothetical protein